MRAKYLRALEAEQFEQLPGHTYIKGFLRTYAESLGMDGQLYVDEYNSRYVVGEEERPLRARRVPTQIAQSAPASGIAARRDRRHGDDPPHGTRDRGLEVRGYGGAEGAGRQRLVQADDGCDRERRVGHGRARRLVHGGSGSRSGAGKPLYRGTLERGQVKRFAPQKLTITLTSPRNVIVRVAGVRVKVPRSGQLTLPRAS